jgi:hypothetical protein
VSALVDPALLVEVDAMAIVWALRPPLWPRASPPERPLPRMSSRPLSIELASSTLRVRFGR